MLWSMLLSGAIGVGLLVFLAYLSFRPMRSIRRRLLTAPLRYAGFVLSLMLIASLWRYYDYLIVSTLVLSCMIPLGTIGEISHVWQVSRLARRSEKRAKKFRSEGNLERAQSYEDLARRARQYLFKDDGQEAEQQATDDSIAET